MEKLHLRKSNVFFRNKVEQIVFVLLILHIQKGNVFFRNKVEQIVFVLLILHL
jgi:hypothetical protein